MGPNRRKAKRGRARLVLTATGLVIAGLVAVQLPELIRYIKMERM